VLSARNMLAVLIVASTVLFVVGVSIEKAEGDHTETAHAEAGETGHSEEDEEILGVELESTPFIVLAAIGSLALALAAWRRPDSEPLLAVVAVAMLAFAVFDIAEVVHLAEESEGGLIVIAVLVAALHLAAGWVAFSMRRQLAAAPA
jgi:hypothetical protein